MVVCTACGALFRAASAGCRIRNKCAKLATARGRRNYDSALVKRALHPRGRKEGPSTVEAIWPQSKREWNADFVWDGIFISFSTRLSAKEITASKRMSILCTDLVVRLLCSHSAIGHGTRPIIGGAVVFLFLNKLNNRSLARLRLYPAPLFSPRSSSENSLRILARNVERARDLVTCKSPFGRRLAKVSIPPCSSEITIIPRTKS